MKVLFVVTAFYPEQAIGAVRISKFAKYFIKAGVDLTIISLTPSSWSKKDETLRFEGLEDIRWIQIDQSNLFKRIFQRARRVAVGDGGALPYVEFNEQKSMLKISFRKWIQMFYSLIKGLDWKYQVTQYAKKNFLEEEFDAIFCSYPSFGSPLAALKLRKDGYSKNVVLDFRDPVSYGQTSLKKVQNKIQNIFLKNVDAVTFVSKGVKKKVLNNYSNKKNLLVYNGFDSDDYSEFGRSNYVEEESNALKFSYVGSLYGGKRNLDVLFSTIKNCIDEGAIVSRYIELHYAGADSVCFIRQAEKFGLTSNVVNHGLMTRDGALNLQGSVDVNIVVTWNTAQDQGILTGKVFESFLMKKPVLGIVNGNLSGSEFCEIIDMVGAGICVEEADFDIFKLKNWIINALNSKLKDGCVSCTYNDSVDAFSYSSNSIELINFIKEDLSVNDLIY